MSLRLTSPLLQLLLSCSVGTVLRRASGWCCPRDLSYDGLEVGGTDSEVVILQGCSLTGGNKMSFPSTLFCRDKADLLLSESPFTPATTSSSELAFLLSSWAAAAARTEGAISPQGSDCSLFSWGRRARLGFAGRRVGDVGPLASFAAELDVFSFVWKLKTVFCCSCSGVGDAVTLISDGEVQYAGEDLSSSSGDGGTFRYCLVVLVPDGDLSVVIMMTSLPLALHASKSSFSVSLSSALMA